MKQDQSTPETGFVPTTQDELRRFLAENFAGAKRAIAPVGGRTALEFGYPLSKPAMTLAVTGLNRVIDFPARDMTVTVEAGIRLDRLAKVLKAEGQRLPIDAAQSNRATLGGAVATNTSGPRRFGYGTFRDYVIGITAVTVDGRFFHSGGRVVKNVAGYDLCKLLIGSLGTLAVVTQLTLKLKPVPESSLLVCATFEDRASMEAAVANLMTSETRPVAIDTLNPIACAALESDARAGLPTTAHLLVVGFEGSLHETNWQVDRLTHELADRRPQELHVIRESAADRLWNALAEFPTTSDEPVAFQANLLPSKIAQLEREASRLQVALLCRAGNGIAIGKLPDHVISVRQAAEILTPLGALAKSQGGSFNILNCDAGWKESLPVFSKRNGAHRLMQNLKQAFDPEDLLNPGRLFR